MLLPVLLLSVGVAFAAVCGPGSYPASGDPSQCVYCLSGKFGDGSACTPCPQGLNSFVGSDACRASYPLNPIGVDTSPDIQGGVDYSRFVKLLSLTDTTFTTLTMLPEPPRCFSMSVTGRFAVFGGLGAVVRYDIPANNTTVIAGSVEQTGLVDDAVGANARFNSLGGMYLSRDETHVLVSDTNNNRLRKVFMNGTVVTLVGGGDAVGAECSGDQALISGPTGIAVSRNESVVVLIEKAARRLRRIDFTNAGIRVAPLAGDELAVQRTVNGVGQLANFHTINDVAFAPDSRFVLVSETADPARRYPSVIRKVELSTGNVTAFFSSNIDAMGFITFANTDNTFLWVNAGSSTFGVPYLKPAKGLTPFPFQDRMRIARAECKLVGYVQGRGGGTGYSNLCSQCPAGKYSAGTGLFTDECTACPANSYSLAGAGQCTANVGYFMAMVRSSAEPQPGYSFLVAGTNLSTAIPATDAPPPPGSSVYVPGNTVSQCPRVLSCANDTFLHCSAFGQPVCCGKQTFFQEAVPLRSECQQCPLGSVSSGAGSTCQSCAVGQRIAGSTCTDCAPGSYSPTNHGSVCALCPAGSYSGEVRAVSLAVCTPCPPGTYQPDAGASAPQACIRCDAGKYQSAQGGVGGCSMCAPGTYQSGAAGSACVSCENANAWSLQGASACVCKAGYTRVNCTACAAGTYKATLGDRVCVECPPDTFCESAATVPTACPPNTQSLGSSPSAAACLCVPGFTGDQCVACGPGTYKPDRGPHPCLDCPANSFCPAAASGPTPCPSSPAHIVSLPRSANSSFCVCDAGFEGANCDPVLNVAAVAGGAAAGVVVLVAAVVGGVRCFRRKGGKGPEFSGRFPGIDLKADLPWRCGYVPLQGVQKD